MDQDDLNAIMEGEIPSIIFESKLHLHLHLHQWFYHQWSYREPPIPLSTNSPYLGESFCNVDFCNTSSDEVKNLASFKGLQP